MEGTAAGIAASAERKTRITHVGRSTKKLLKVEYFMRQYPTLSEALSTLLEQYEAERELRQSWKRSAQ